MTSHDYDAYLDACAENNERPMDYGWDVLCGKPNYHEDLLLAEREAEREKAAHEAALRRQGAKEALENLRKYLFEYALGEQLGHPDEIYGLQFAHREIQERINSLEVPVEAGERRVAV